MKIFEEESSADIKVQDGRIALAILLEFRKVLFVVVQKNNSVAFRPHLTIGLA
jgi:hypothetical protein